MNTFLLIIIVTLAGPLIGSLIGVLHKPKATFMYNMLSFAAGVMLAISFLELLPAANSYSNNIIFIIIGLILGAVVMYLFDKIIPHIHPELCAQEHGRNLKKTSYYLIFGMFLHHFPEGIAIGISNAAGATVSLSIALAIAVHDIPEAICTSVPYYLTTKKRLKSFLISFATALPTVVGFIISYYIFEAFSPALLAVMTAATAGIMIYISGDELIPASCSKMSNHSTIFSLIAGVIFVILLKLI